MTVKKKRKKRILFATAIILVPAICIVIWLSSRSSEPVNVYSFQYIGMTEFWGDIQESYGPVTTDKIQTEFLSDTQTVTEINIKEGDAVKKGDVLFSFDTTLDALSLERKRLEVEKIKVQIKAAEERLQDTREMVPFVPPELKEPEEEDLGEALQDKLYKISENPVYDGTKPEKALICWLKEGTPISDAILKALYDTSLEYQQKNEEQKEVSSNASAVPVAETVLYSTNEEQETVHPTEVPRITLYPFYNGKAMEEYEILPKEVQEEGETVKKYIIPDTDKFYDDGDKTCWLVSAKRKSDNMELTQLEIPLCPEDDAGRNDWEALWGKGIELRYIRGAVFEGKIVKDNHVLSFTEENAVSLKVDEKAVLVITSQLDRLERPVKVEYSIEKPANGLFEITTDGNQLYLIGTPKTTTAEAVEYTVKARFTFQDNEGGTWWADESYTFSVSVDSQQKKGTFFVVFKVTQGDYLKAMPIVWQGAEVTVYEDGRFDIRPYDASGFTDHTLPPPEDIEIELPDIDPNEMYTAEQILDMQKQCYAAIKEQNEKLKLAESEYSIMQRELGDGKIYAEIDGKVVSVLTEEEARAQNQPLLKVSGGGGFYIEGSVSELEKENLKLGQEVTVNDWNSGASYTGKVVSIGDFPSDKENWNGMGNPTASYYPFKAFVGEEADLQAGSFASMSYSTASAEQGIYLEKPFVRSENGRYWIYVRGSDGKLEKRDVRVGRVLWGSYYEILSPLSNEDYLAFPYGKHVKPGAPTVESDLSALYGY